MIRKLLVANRGEIAVRIFETAHELGISTVAVYADPDRETTHVYVADTAIALHGDTAAETYLDIEKLLDAARRTGADAIHPGYGFLAESPAFARAVVDAGLIWVGPSPEAIEAMADKVAAKARVSAVGVPLLPSATVEGDDQALWTKAADEVGYPLLVKAAAGGGGKGMTLVSSPDGLAEAIVSARRVAASSFGDPTVFLERYLERPRHVEVQIFGDNDGTVLHYFTRDCSVQRRHQKVIEEAPAPGLDDALRERLHQSAIAAAQSVDYVGAGTVEFLVSGDECFFLEMNTRLQVEHRVTERICSVGGRNLDLVALQLRVASGQVLGIVQDDVTQHGHSFEARLYAEDPANDFLPSVGTIEVWEGFEFDDLEILEDRTFEDPGEVSPYFDPLIAKWVSRGRDRTQAAGRLARALRLLRVHGVTTNRDSLVAVLEHEAFLEGEVHTGFFGDHPETLTAAPPEEVTRRHAIAATLALRAERDEDSELPKVARAGWRNIVSTPVRQSFTCRGTTIDVDYGPPPRSGNRLPVSVDGTAFTVDGISVESTHVDVEINGEHLCAKVYRGDEHIWVNDKRWQTELTIMPRFTVGSGDATAHGPSAPVPGTVVSIDVAVGDAVEMGQTLVVVEAMKMEHRLAADVAGTVTEVRVAAGDKVDAHEVLVIVEPANET